MWRLRDEASALVAQYELLQRKIALMTEELSMVENRDKMVYRAIFSQDTISVATPPIDLIPSAEYGRYGTLVQNTHAELEALARRLYIASLSLDDIEQLSINKDAMAERIPAIWPVDRRLIRNHIGAFGTRIDPVYRNVRHHDGVDFSAPVGTPIVATGNGVVTTDKAKGGYGLQVLVDHGFGYKTRYAHLSKILVRPGQNVVRGEVIGLMGSTGKSTGSHLHYEVIHRGRPVNPISYFSRDMTSDEFQKIIANARQITYETE